jgi:hypothetical protein
MRTDTWFFVAIIPVGGNAVQDHLRRLHANHPTAMLRTFEGDGQQVNVLFPDTIGVAENAR